MNKRKLLVFILMIAGVIIGAGARSQSLVIKLTDGSEAIDPLNTIQSLKFSSGDLLVNFLSGSTDTYGLSGIRRLYFNTAIGIGEQKAGTNTSLEVYPNPGSTVITVKGIPAGAGSVTFYGLDGRRVLTGVVDAEQAVIDISRLQPGLYLIHAMGRTVKFVRQ